MSIGTTKRGGRDERPLAHVPRPLQLLLALAVALQIGTKLAPTGEPREVLDLPAPPSEAVLRLASLGESALAARLAMLYLQSFDLRAGNEAPFQRLDYDTVALWLATSLRLDSNCEYPLFIAARVYAEVPDQKRVRRMIEFVHGAFLEDPNRRWPYLAHVTLLAKHKLHDLDLARRYASDLVRLTTDPALPLWAMEFESFILENMGELEAARIMLGGLMASGRIKDPEERRFLELRLKELETRTAGPQSGH